MGTMTVAIDLAFGGGPLVFGLVAAQGGIPLAFLAGGVLSAIGALAALSQVRSWSPARS
jgi:hypothetical protein